MRAQNDISMTFSNSVKVFFKGHWQQKSTICNKLFGLNRQNIL